MLFADDNHKSRINTVVHAKFVDLALSIAKPLYLLVPSYESSQVQPKYTIFLCDFTTTCYVELCLLFELSIGKLIHAGALTAESCYQEIHLKNTYPRTPQHRY